MNNSQEKYTRGEIRKAQVLDDGSVSLIEETDGVKIEVVGAKETHVLDVSDKRWEQLRQANRAENDLVLDKDGKTITLKKKTKRDK